MLAQRLEKALAVAFVADPGDDFDAGRLAFLVRLALLTGDRLDIDTGAEGQADVIFRLTFDGGTSSGQNLQTIIDNIQLTGVPEPTTVAGGLLGVLALCWHQRRRLIRSVRFRRT